MRCLLMHMQVTLADELIILRPTSVPQHAYGPLALPVEVQDEEWGSITQDSSEESTIAHDAYSVQRHAMPKDGASHDGVRGSDAASSSSGDNSGHQDERQASNAAASSSSASACGVVSSGSTKAAMGRGSLEGAVRALTFGALVEREAEEARHRESAVGPGQTVSQIQIASENGPVRKEAPSNRYHGLAPGWSEDEAANGFWREVLHKGNVTDDTIARLISGLRRVGVKTATAQRLQRGLDVLPPECIGDTASSAGKKVRTTNDAVC